MTNTTTTATDLDLRDRLDIADTIYRYASAIDVKDSAGVRSVLHDDLWAQYGNTPPLVGGQAVADWIAEATKDCLWQHHLLSVYHVVVDGDRATALTYHTSHQGFVADPETDVLLVGRYHQELLRTPDGWKISRLLFEIVWADRRQDTTGMLHEVGGRGPAAPPPPR